MVTLATVLVPSSHLMVIPTRGRGDTEHCHHHRRFCWTMLALNTHLRRRPAETFCRPHLQPEDRLTMAVGGGRSGDLWPPRRVGQILTEPPALLFSAGVSFLFEALLFRGGCLSAGGGALG